jgi:Leucine-rich repeat (LRR) protein
MDSQDTTGDHANTNESLQDEPSVQDDLAGHSDAYSHLMDLVLGDEELIKNEERKQRISAPASTMRQQARDTRPSNDGGRSKSLPGGDRVMLERVVKSGKPDQRLDHKTPYAQAASAMPNSSNDHVIEKGAYLNSASFDRDHHEALVPTAHAEASHNGHGDNIKQKYKDDASLLKEESAFDLMAIVARRSNDFGGASEPLAMGENLHQNSGRSEANNGNNDVGGGTYYADGNDNETRRTNIKQAGPALGSAPGAYGAAPGSRPRRVRSIRFSNVGNSHNTADDAAYADYLQQESYKLRSSKVSSNQTMTLIPEQHQRNTDKTAQDDKDALTLAGGRTESTMYLVEARAVMFESERNVVGEADLFDGPMEEEKQRQREKRTQYYRCGILCVVAVPVLIVLILWWSGVFDRARNIVVLTEAPSHAPTSAPTASPTPYFLPLPEFTIEAIMNNPNGSPQAKAYQWIQDGPNIEQYSDERKQQRYALATFHYSTNGDNWTLQDDWLSYEVHECDWRSKWINVGPDSVGVCDENGNYLSLIMTLNGLSGSLVPEIALLSHLRFLDVASNAVTGQLPTELGLLTRLQDLSADFNELTSTLPTELALMSSMEVLVIHTNDLKGRLPSELGLMTQLKVFETGGGQLSGSLPSELGRMTALTSLALHDNNLEGTIPRELWNLTNLSFLLQLGSNRFTGTLATEVGLLSNLEFLRLDSTSMNGTLPSELGSMVKLTFLDLCCGNFWGGIVSELGLLSNLDTLYLENNGLSGTIPTELGNAEVLQLLNLPSNRLSGPIPSEISRLTDLDRLYLYINTLSGPIPSELGLMANLTTLDLDSNTLTSTIPTELGMMASLEALWLGDNAIGSMMPTQLGLLSNTLMELQLDSIRLYGFLPTEIGRLSALQILKLSETLLLGPLRSELGLLTSLVTLEIQSTFFQGTIPSEFEHLTASLSSFTLNNTLLTGTIPSGLCALPDLHFDCTDGLCGCDCDCLD